MTTKKAVWLVLAAGVLSLLLVASGFYKSNINYRIKSGSQADAARYFATRWQSQPTQGLEFNTADDPGPAYTQAIWVIIFKKLGFGYPHDGYVFTMGCLLFLFLAIGTVGLARAISPGFAATFLSFLVLTPAMGKIAFSSDVYLFPVFAAFSMIWASTYFSEKISLKAWPIIASPFLLALCDLFRGGAYLVLIFPVVLLLWPRMAPAPQDQRPISRSRWPAVRRNAALYVALSVALLAAQKRLQSDYFHPVWHSIHAGLFEFGGYVNPKTATTLPKFVKAPPTGPDVEVRDHWSDGIQAIFLSGHTSDYRLYRYYDPNWDLLFKKDVIRLAREETAGMVSHFLKRLWRWTVVNPFQPTDASSGILFSTGRDLLVRIALIAGLVVAFLQLPIRIWVLALSLGGLAAPALLVHSGYVMYSFPGHFTIYLLIGAGLHSLFQKTIRTKTLQSGKRCGIPEKKT